MNNEPYQKALEAAQVEFDRWVGVRTEIDARIAQLKSAIVLLSALLSESPPKVSKEETAEEFADLGISEAIRKTLKESGVGMTPVQIKARLVESQFDLNKYVNPSAVIHNTLRRLESQKEVVPVRDSSGTTAYALYIDAGANPQLARLDAYFEANRQMAAKFDKIMVPQSVIDALERPLGAAQAAVAKQMEEFDRVGKEIAKKMGGFK